MEEIESPVEHLEDEIREIAEEVKERWLTFAALMSALFAVLAAIAGLEAGHYANEAMLSQIAASDAWNYYQAKGIKGMIAESLPGDEVLRMQKVETYRAEQENIKKDAKAKAKTSEHYLMRHEILAKAVTLFQIAIAMTAISVLTRKRKFLFVSLALAMGGAFFFAQSWLL